MKMKTIINFTLIYIPALVIMMGGCFNEFTEEDLLKTLSHADLNIVLNDASQTGADMSGFTVTITSSGERESGTTDESGIVNFQAVKIGSVPVTIEKEGFITIKGTYQFNSVDDFEQSQQSIVVPVLPSEGAAMATITGNVKIDQNLTTLTREDIPSGINLFELTPLTGLPAGLSYEDFSFTAVSTEGGYTIEVPAMSGGLTYNVSYKSFVLPQELAINRFADSPQFPFFEPTITQVDTEYGTGGAPANIPNVTGTFAVIDQSTSGNTAVLGNVTLTANGGVNAINIISPGSGYNPNSNNVPVRVQGLVRGSGANVTANTNANGSITGINVLDPGSGYTNTNPNVRPPALMTSGLGTNISVQPGNEHIRNINYGTGISRIAQVQ